MSKIEKKERDELSYNASIMVDSYDNAVEECWDCVINDLNPNISEMVEAMKYIIDSGWSHNIIFARKTEYVDENHNLCTGVMITGDESKLNYYEERGYLTFPKDFPTVIGQEKRIKEEGKSYSTYDGDVVLRLYSGELITLEEWEKLSVQPTKTR